MKNILIITSYFPPETGAASNRMYQLASGLKRLNYDVSVLTPLPNYPTGKIFNAYRGAFKRTTLENGISVHRLWIYASNSKNKLLRLLAMISYSFSLLWFFMWKKVPNTVIVQSPPLLVAFTCMCFLNKKKRKLILNVSDLWPIAGLELGAFKKNIAYRLLERIEKFNYRKADLILGQSEEILTHVLGVVPEKNTLLYRNFPDFSPPKLDNTAKSGSKIKLVYAGLLGVAQGIFKLCQELEFSKIEFHIYGTGSEKSKIETFIKKHPHLPIRYHGEVTRTKLHQELQTYDLTIIPLLNRIYGSVPSKIFEYARLGLPILYFGGGEGENIITGNNLGWVAQAGNYQHLNTVVSTITSSELHLERKLKIQQTAVKNFNFHLQLEELNIFL